MRGVIRDKRTYREGECVKEKEYLIDGRSVSAEAFAAAFPDQPLAAPPGAEASWRKPIDSDGLACHPKRIKDMERFCEKHGVPTDFTTHRGRPLITSRAQRKKLLKIFKHHDNHGGYGD